MMNVKLLLVLLFCALCTGVVFAQESGNKIIHDAEHYILEAQNRERWAVDDAAVTKTLAEIPPGHSG